MSVIVAQALPSGQAASTARTESGRLEKISTRATPITEDKLRRLQELQDQINRPVAGVPESGRPVTGPAGGGQTETSSAAPGTFSIFRNKKLTASAVVPPGYRSNVSEVSIDGDSKYQFATGNWWAARSTNGGGAWTFVDPFTLANFCCDQVVIYDRARNMLLWLRMTVLTSGGSYLENQYYIGTSLDGGATFCSRSFTPGQTGDAGDWYDYPHWALTTGNLWLTTNEFNSAGFYSESKILRIGLDALHDTSCASGLGYGFWGDLTIGTLTPATGGKDVMYIGAHVNTSTIRIYNAQDAGNLFSTDKALGFTWTSTNRGDAVCSSPDNWGGRTDARITSGTISRDNTEHYLTFFWNVQEGGGFPFPYVEAVQLRLRDLAVLGRPFIWNSAACFLYASAAANARGDIGLVVNYGATAPSIYAGIDDDFNGAPPGWEVRLVKAGSFGPTDDKYGDYNTARAHAPSGLTWIGGSHVLPSCGGTPDCAEPYLFQFGRERDRPVWQRWLNK